MKQAWGLAVVVLMVIGSSGRSQRNESQGLPPEGTQAFRNLLHLGQFQPVKRLDELEKLDPAETLIVVFGDNSRLIDISRRVGGLEKFRQAGGAFLIASDRPTGNLLGEWGLRINGERVFDQAMPYKGIPSCPMIAGVAHPLFDGMAGRLASNRPSFLQFLKRGGMSAEFEVLGSFSKGSLLKANFPNTRRQVGPFMVGTKGPDRVLVLAGHSVFMNMLLVQPDNDNATFALNCSRWLSQAPGGKKRKFALFIEDRRIITEFNFGLIGPPRIPLPTTQVLNHLLRGLEQEKFFPKVFASFFDRDQVMRALLFLLSALLALYGGWRFLRARYRIEWSVPLVAAATFPGAEPAVLVQRGQALMKQGNFGEAAQALAASFFEKFVPQAARRQGGAFPFLAQGTWVGQWALLRKTRYLWELAYGSPRPVSARKMARLPGILDQVALALRKGRLSVHD